MNRNATPNLKQNSKMDTVSTDLWKRTILVLKSVQKGNPFSEGFLGPKKHVILGTKREPRSRYFFEWTQLNHECSQGPCSFINIYIHTYIYIYEEPKGGEQWRNPWGRSGIYALETHSHAIKILWPLQGSWWPHRKVGPYECFNRAHLEAAWGVPCRPGDLNTGGRRSP